MTSKMAPMMKSKMICMRTDSCENVTKGFIGTLSFFGVVFSRMKSTMQAIRQINPRAMA